MIKLTPEEMQTAILEDGNLKPMGEVVAQAQVQKMLDLGYRKVKSVGEMRCKLNRLCELMVEGDRTDFLPMVEATDDEYEEIAQALYDWFMEDKDDVETDNKR